MGEIVDLIAAQGMVAGMIYGYVPDPPWGPSHRCPGCQPCPDEPALATHWNKWQALETKLRVKGESASCPIARGESLPASYTNAERVAHGGMQTDRLPRYEPQQAPQLAPSTATPSPIVEPVQPIEAQAPKEEPAKPQRKTPAKRAPKPHEAPKGQGSLW